MARSRRERKNKPPQPRPQPMLYRFLPALIIVAGLAAYYNSFSGVFLLDDKKDVIQRLPTRNLSDPVNLIVRSRRPVVDLTLAANYALGRYEPRGYHVVNLAVHILAALTLFGVIRRTLIRPRFGPQLNEAAAWLALTTALLWVVHPLTTQSVTYVVQRGESMMGLFYLLTLYCVIRGAAASKPKVWHTLAVCCCGLGMGSKAVMVTAPLMVLLYDRAIVARSFREALLRRWGLYLGLAATWGILAACGIVRGVLFPGDAPATVGFGTKEITPLEYAATEPGVILHYLRLSLWPHPLCLDYAWPVARTAGRIVPGVIVLAALIGGTVATLKRRPPLGFLGAWFLLILAPTSSFVPIKDPIFEHRMYLPLAAVIMLVVLAGDAVVRLAASRFSVGAPLRRGLAAGLATVIVITAIWATVRRNRDYHSRQAMWSNVLAQYPDNARAQVNLGSALTDKGASDKARKAYQSAVEIDPNNYTAHYNLGNNEFRNRKFAEAIPHYERAVQIKDNYTDAHVNWAMALDNLDQTDEAIERFRIAIDTKPAGNRSKPIVEAHYRLGNVFFRTRQFDEAAIHFRATLMAKPSHIAARFNLAHALWQQHKMEEADQQFREVLRRKPNHAEARQGLDALLGKSDQSRQEQP